jgi:hypothetical protein
MIASGGNQLFEPSIATGRQVSRAHPTTPFLSASYMLNFDEGLQVISVGDGLEFELVFASTQAGLGRIMDQPFFPEAVSSFLRSQEHVSLFMSNFRPLPNAEEIRAEWSAEHDRFVVNEVVRFVQNALAFLLAYLMVFSTILFFVTKNGLLDGFIKMPASGERGVDIVKILTFGILTIDHDIPGHRMVVTMFLLTVIFAILVSWQSWA